LHIHQHFIGGIVFVVDELFFPATRMDIAFDLYSSYGRRFNIVSGLAIGSAARPIG
jgi:hypothetical protein